MSGAINTPRIRAAKPKGWRSGFCGLTNPPDSHARCTLTYGGTPCCCDCHQETAMAPQTPAATIPQGEPVSRDVAAGTLHGFVYDLDEVEYHAHPTSLSVTGAKVLLKAPALFDWQRKNTVYKSVWDFGSAAHAEVLGVGCPIVVHEYDPEKVKSPKSTNAWKAQQVEVRASGGVLLLPDEHAQVRAMAAQLKNHRLAMQLLSSGAAEVSAFVNDDETGVTMRSRFDWLAPDIITDYKSCASANPMDWAGRYGVIKKLGYDNQAEWYLDVARRLGHSARAFAWIAQEKDPPYLVSVIYADEEALDVARERNRFARQVFRDCTGSGIWPGYLDDRSFAQVSLSFPAWEAVEVAS